MPKETRSVDNVYHSNGNPAKKIHFSEILSKVSIPSMDYETVERPSIKSRINIDRSPLRTGRSTVTTLKPALAPKQRIMLNSGMPSERKLGASSAVSIRSRIGPQLSSSLQDRISSIPSSYTRDRGSLTPAPLSIRERISSTSAASVRERISLKSVPSVRERISLKSGPSVRERISLKSGPSVRERISSKPVASISGRLESAHNLIRTSRSNASNVKLSHRGKSAQIVKPFVKDRLGSSANHSSGLKRIGNRIELNSGSKKSNSSDVFSRLG